MTAYSASAAPRPSRLGSRVMVVDSSDELSGGGTPPSQCLGGARVMAVPARAQQAALL